MQTFDVTAALAAWTKLPRQSFMGPSALASLHDDGAGNLTITHWDASLGAAPTVAALLAGFAFGGAPTSAQLVAYAETKRGQIAAGGISVNIAAAGAAQQLVEVGTDTAGLALLANAVQLTSTAPGTPYDWDQAQPVTLNGAQVVAIQVAVGLFNQLLFQQKTAIRAAIAAGTITTFAQIDDPTTIGLPAWPSNS